MLKNSKQTPSGLQVPANTSLVCCTTSKVHTDDTDLSVSKPARQPRRENTRDGRERMSLHSVFVLGSDGKPLTPTTPAKARKLLEGGQAKKAWSKFGTFGIQMLVETRKETPLTVLGYDIGTKYEGIVVVSGTENVLAVKLDLPDKSKIVRKMKERRALRRSRRKRNCRRRLSRYNKLKKGFIAPSQKVILFSRFKVLGSCFKIYPITVVGQEDIHFNHYKYRWGANFTTMEVGKSKIKEFFDCLCSKIFYFRGYETESFRQKYDYQKTFGKAEDKFTAHCSDALAIACEVGPGFSVKPGKLLVVDDTYRPMRRRLHDINPSLSGSRSNYSRGTVFGLRKGLLIGAPCGKSGQLCGEERGKYRYYDKAGKRQAAVKLSWVSSQFVTREGLT
jgi:hypothetical protein